VRLIRFLLGPLVVGAATVALIAPAGAGAATTVGETFTPSGYPCQDNNWELQTTSPSDSYVVTSAGILTSFSYLGGADQPPNGLKLEVARTTATPDQYLTVGASAEKFPAINTMNTYTDISIPVQAGDMLGLHSDGTNRNCGVLASGYTTHYLGLTDPVAGDTVTTTFTAGVRLDISATLEADCDADGLGDETQDADKSSCSPPPSTTPPTGQGAPAVHRKKCRKKKHRTAGAVAAKKKCKKKRG
jgi:hypothetical protein